MRNTSAARAISDSLDKKRQCLAGFIQSYGALDEESAGPLAGILMAVLDGLSLQKYCDPEFDIDSSNEVLARLFEQTIPEQRLDATIPDTTGTS